MHVLSRCTFIIHCNYYDTGLNWYTLYLFQDDSVPVELVGSGGSVLDLRWYNEPKCCQLPHLSQKRDKLVTVVHPQLAITMTQLHKTTTCLKPIERAHKQENTVIRTRMLARPTNMLQISRVSLRWGVEFCHPRGWFIPPPMNIDLPLLSHSVTSFTPSPPPPIILDIYQVWAKFWIKSRGTVYDAGFSLKCVRAVLHHPGVPIFPLMRLFLIKKQHNFTLIFQPLPHWLERAGENIVTVINNDALDIGGTWHKIKIMLQNNV